MGCCGHTATHLHRHAQPWCERTRASTISPRTSLRTLAILGISPRTSVLPNMAEVLPNMVTAPLAEVLAFLATFLDCNAAIQCPHGSGVVRVRPGFVIIAAQNPPTYSGSTCVCGVCVSRCLRSKCARLRACAHTCVCSQ